MARALRWGAAGGVVGFNVFAILFFMALSQRLGRPDQLLLMAVFAVMGAASLAMLGGVFGAVRSAMEELEELWREIDRLQDE
jgi:hypothetical protein